MVHRADVVDHLLDVSRATFAKDVGLGSQEVLKGALRAIDLA